MEGYLLGTNVISELAKKRPNRYVLNWFATTPNCWLSVLSVGEMLRGARRLSVRDPKCAALIETWVQSVRSGYADNLLTIDEGVVEEWAKLPTSRTLSVVDSLIAATAGFHNLTVVTRNATDFADLDVPLFNPFEAP